MTSPEPIPPLPYASPLPYSQTRDVDHLNLLALFHYIFGAIVLAFSLLALVYVTLGFLMVAGKLNGSTTQPDPPAAFGWLFVVMGFVGLFLGWTIGILVIYSGRCIKARKKWMFSLVIAGIMCLNMPFGTVLGVFTLVVLLRDSAKRLYGIDVPPPYPYPAPPPN